MPPVATKKLTSKSTEWEAKASLSFSIAVPPVPASRPRVTRWGVYYAKTYKTWMDAAAVALSDVGHRVDGPLRVSLLHVVARPKTTQRDYPRGDVDNYAKASLDAITKCERVWDDDDQILELITSKRFATPGEEPHTEVTVWQLT